MLDLTISVQSSQTKWAGLPEASFLPLFIPFIQILSKSCQKKRKNEKERDGKIILQHSVRIQKQYRNDDGDYQDTDYFFPNELPDLELVTRKAFEYIKLKESESEDADS